MRYIDPNDVQMRAMPEWKEAALKLGERLAASEVGPDREALLGEAQRVWQQVKPALEAAGHHKCWYCETRQTRAANDVDHYRPKGRVAECQDHPGYFWLAIELLNLRLSCQFCNRPGSDQTRSTAGGKADHFPLANEEHRCRAPGDNLAAEDPMLLDPTRVGDPMLLWVDEFGRPVANPTTAPAGSDAERRVEASIKILNLDEKRIVDARLEVSVRVIETLNAAEAISAIERPDEYQTQIRQLISMARGTSEYSLVARCRLRERDLGEQSVAHFVLQNL